MATVTGQRNDRNPKGRAEMHDTKPERQTRPARPGDVFGECPACGEQWERTDNQWTCDHCGYTQEANPDGTPKPGHTPEPGSNPTPGAIEAAEIITGGKFGNPKRYPTTYGTKTVQGVAAVIDRHTHAPELAAALQSFPPLPASDTFDGVLADSPADKWACAVLNWYESKARAALAAAGVNP